MKIIFALLLLVSLASASQLFSESHYQGAFTNWMVQYDRQYANVEFASRYATFKKNFDFVHKWNQKGSATVLGMNKFADISNEEYRRVYLGTVIDGTQYLAAAKTNKLGRVQNVNADLVDWRAKGAVTAIKNQGQCGSCWSFSTTGGVEGAHQISGQNLVAFSEQNLMDCSWSYGNQGCDGGLMTAAFEYVIANKGLDSEESYPYKGKSSHTCGYKAANSVGTISSYVNVTSGSETDLETQANSGPVSVAIDASHNSFQLYTSGIYYEASCSTTALDHGVLVVGYGSGTPSAADGNFWIVKNSWGTDWGVEGYIFMSKDRNNNCGIATMASRAIA
ncbi:hypothetical protein SAMD00019534_040020 [Acytostelium subglobosum LB1]|uniref:hypothetical protein n=1 Tax=Acytostelium subglobosum LB1 TaxID=1410327 RepID=UPI000644D9C3|nr:hypothetical protein SAMD00019534_040020 [Acytostelium subglobosum LB1]GAM20827.1 hypothetical protein SAMD00019534_040020 [Acytostelium subglobosum LB1]|eukprot:XP_012755961.1 hypothetical protein SAMD00019534_040020 [Acytostelium subglobosum LB1]